MFKTENPKDFIVAVMGNRIKCELMVVGIYSVRPFWGFKVERLLARDGTPLQLLSINPSVFGVLNEVQFFSKHLSVFYCN